MGFWPNLRSIRLSSSCENASKIIENIKLAAPGAEIEIVENKEEK
jgi:hypothetical protein